MYNVFSKTQQEMNLKLVIFQTNDYQILNLFLEITIQKNLN